jgi:hypothetical protein
MTRRTAEVLAWLLAFDGEDTLVYERGTAYFGTKRVGAGLVLNLIRAMYVSGAGGRPNEVEHFRINETGRAALAEHLGVTCR